MVCGLSAIIALGMLGVLSLIRFNHFSSNAKGKGIQGANYVRNAEKLNTPVSCLVKRT
jgi:hypothetical protein